MATLASFLQEVLVDGRIAMHEPPANREEPEALAVLRRAHASDALTIAGPALPLDEPTALAAGRLLQWSAWYLLNPHLPIEPRLAMHAPPKSPEQHLSADLTLRFLATLHRRAKALGQNDALPIALERILREWPFSGVVADIVEPPLTPIDFGKHPGLNFLYAERLAEHVRAGWLPRGIGMEYVELVWIELGKDVSTLPALLEASQELMEQETA